VSDLERLVALADMMGASLRLRRLAGARAWSVLAVTDVGERILALATASTIRDAVLACAAALRDTPSPDRRLPAPPPVPRDARPLAVTWAPPRDMIPDDELDSIFGVVERVDPGPLLEELGSLRSDLRRLAATHGWTDEERES